MTNGYGLRKLITFSVGAIIIVSVESYPTNTINQILATNFINYTICLDGRYNLM